MSFFAELKRRNVIRVAIFYVISAWLLLQIADLIFEVLLVPDWTLRFIFGTLVAAFPFVLFLAWAYEVTPEGLKRQAEVDRSASITGQTARKLDGVIAGLLVVLVGAVVIDRFRPGDDPPPTGDVSAETAAAPAADRIPEIDDGVADSTASAPSIAVLPFRDMSATGDQDYFAEGIAEEILNALVRVDGLQVASRTSSFSFKDQNLALPAIAERLDVSHVLEGSVRTAGDRIRVTAQLIEVAADRHLWSETFDRNLDDVFAIQDEITARVAGELESRLIARVSHPSGDPLAAPESSTLVGTTDPEAYRLYLRGRHEWRQRNAESLARAIELFRQAIDRDPRFARAWSNLAAALINSSAYDPEVDRKVVFAQAEDAARTALALDPELGEGLMVRGYLLSASCRFIEAEAAYRAAVAADPEDPSVHHWLASMLGQVGRTREAHEAAERAYAIDPLNAAIVVTVGLLNEQIGNPSLALEQLRESARLGIFGGDPFVVGEHLARQGRFDEARVVLQKSVLNDLPGWIDGFLKAIREPGNDPALEQELARQARPVLPPTILGGILAAMNSELIAEHIGVGCEDNHALLSLWHPQAVELRGSDRLYDLFESIGLVDYWRAYGWPDRCEDLPQDRAECPR